MIALVVSGFATGLSLIVAIGAQNAFVLRQGIRREHVGVVVAICVVADAALILAGVAGIGTLVERAPAVLEVVRVAGVVFLLGYAALALRRAVRPGVLRAGDTTTPTRRGTAVATVLALTLLNPHVYLDTVLLLGSIASTHGSDGRWWFATGAVLGSTVWFVALGFGARWLAPVFARPAAWRVLDGAIAVVMVLIAVSVARG
ncbi:L-lysine exporter [Aeromicrobium marinum DSM 15272]|uniref:L-lysine exporter n=1 Tax=Aeromicrobium marinum DSM 15272 TaxID=585531 RepID=E2S8L3_9ACTN|nr:LysE/ArgO family amino acid transporter [Aeromicrobium marinum]EFQ84518.1 L-lysine exporter [Aeromicrobium marinum DSM 15272]